MSLQNLRLRLFGRYSWVEPPETHLPYPDLHGLFSAFGALTFMTVPIRRDAGALSFNNGRLSRREVSRPASIA